MVIAGFVYWFFPVQGYAVASTLFGWMLIMAGVVQFHIVGEHGDREAPVDEGERCQERYVDHVGQIAFFKKQETDEQQQHAIDNVLSRSGICRGVDIVRLDADNGRRRAGVRVGRSQASPRMGMVACRRRHRHVHRIQTISSLNWFCELKKVKYGGCVGKNRYLCTIQFI